MHACLSPAESASPLRRAGGQTEGGRSRGPGKGGRWRKAGSPFDVGLGPHSASSWLWGISEPPWFSRMGVVTAIIVGKS